MVGRFLLFDYVTLERLGRLIEDLLAVQRAAQLDVLGMRPNQRISRNGQLKPMKARLR
jgi:hypothetical protein